MMNQLYSIINELNESRFQPNFGYIILLSLFSILSVVDAIEMK